MNRKLDQLLSSLAWGSSLLTSLLIILTLLLYRVNLPGGIVQRGYHPDPATVVMAIMFPLVGAVILSKLPRHPIGWLLFWIGLLQAIQQYATQFGIYAIYTRPNPFGPMAAWTAGYTWYPSAVLFILLLMLYPTGDRLAGHWAVLIYVPIAGLIGSLGISAMALFLPMAGPYFDPSASQSGGLDAYFLIFYILLLLSFPLAGVVLLRRYLLSRGVERQQLKWFALSGALWVTTVTLLSGIDAANVSMSSTVDLFNRYFILPAVSASIPISMGIAILKHRLYEIDLLIRKTLVYGALTAALAFIYFGSIIVLEGVLRALTGQLGQSSVAIVLSTLVIAALFNPLRLTIQGAIDKRFYRRKYNAQRTLETFAASLRDEVDLDELSARLTRVVEETLQPDGLTLWIRKYR